MKIKIQAARGVLIDILVRNKILRSAAAIIAEDYLEGELQGKRSHGLMAFPSLVKKLPLKSSPAKVIKKAPSYIFVDANHNLGSIVGRRFADQAMRMAKRSGVAVVFIKNMITWVRPGAIARYIAKQGMLGLVVNSGGSPMVAPPGGYEPVIGTNPIGLGIPTENEDVVIDMATARQAWGAVREALAKRAKLPAGTFFDNRGNFTLDPKKAFSVIAAGDYKGFSLALFIEILTGSFIGMPMSYEKTLSSDYRNRLRGAMMLILNPQFSTVLNKFKKENKKLIKAIKHSKKRKGSKAVLIPGDRSMAKRNEALRKGFIDVDKELWLNLVASRG